jgi:hypothetical protein
VDFQEFVELMIKREAERETPEDLKQAFRVFDKVGTVKISFVCVLILHSGWQWLCVNFRDKVCSLEVGLHLVDSFLLLSYYCKTRIGINFSDDELLEIKASIPWVNDGLEIIP